MNCDKYLNLIDDLVEGELDERTADEVSLHVFDCQDCASQMEMLEREKEMYSHYLFEIEPPKDILEKFQAKLALEETQTVSAAQTSFKPLIWISNLFASIRLNPTFAIAVSLILLVFGFGLFSLFTEEKTANKAANSQPNLPAIQIQPPQKLRGEVFTIPEGEKPREIAKNEASKDEESAKPIAVKQIESVKREAKPKSLPEVKKLSEEELEIREIQSLESETAKQLEKVELLLRSFRNARLIDGSEIYDISFEKQQARKLLNKNILLRQKAEFYGTLDTEKMLSKIEPYLLDIANLEVSSAPEQVLEIKERVKNQNIIASLQGF
jgi:hypothetical protein